MTSSDLSRWDSEVLQPTLKSLPRRAEGRRLRDLGSMELSILGGEIPLPAAMLKASALSHNSAWMRDFASRSGAVLCPHGKTTMSPQLFDMQLRDGCWGITAATAGHLRTYRRFGVRRVLLANQVVDRANIDLLLDELEADDAFECLMLVDSAAGLGRLQEAARARRLRRPVEVLLEIGAAGGRAGVRSLDEALGLGRALRDAAPTIVLRGVETFEGIWSGADHARVELRVLAMLDMVAAIAKAGFAEGWFPPGEVILSAGGSAFFDLAARVLAEVPGRPVRVVLRSGCYLSHDALHYERMQGRIRERAGALWGSGPGLVNALEVWSVVQSVPEATRAIVALGKRDISHDIELPRPLWWFRAGMHDAPQPARPDLRVSMLNDQHAFVDGDADMPWQVGDLVGFGVGHPCTTFDKWPLLYVVDDGYRVTRGIRTYF